MPKPQGPAVQLAPEAVITGKLERIRQKRGILQFFTKLIAILILFVLVFCFVYGVAVVHGDGMRPGFRDGDVTLFFRIENEYLVGTIVTFRLDDQRYFSRVVAGAGDTVDMTNDGGLLVNGHLQQEDIYFPTFKDTTRLDYPYTVPEGHVFLLGDYRIDAVDSREIGALSMREIDGKVLSILRRRSL